MPPLPRNKTARDRMPSGAGQTEDAAGARESVGDSPPPRSSRPVRQTQRETLRIELARTYMIVGTVLQPFGRFVPALDPVGNSLKSFSEDAADAWMEVADKDPKVMDMIKSMMSASTWGNVIGIHIAIFAAAVPGGQAVGQAMANPTAMQSPDDEVEYMGQRMTRREMEFAQQVAAQMQAPQGMPARDQSTGGPGDTVRVPPPVQFVPPKQTQPVPTAAPPVQQAVGRPAKASIPSPVQLGVTVPGQQGAYSFPADHQAASGGNGR